MRRLIPILVSGLILVMPLTASASPDFARAKKFILEGVIRTSSILKSYNQPRAVVSEELRKELRDGFDMKAIASFMLGPYEKQITPVQKRRYMKEFEEFIVQTYTNRVFQFGPKIKSDISDIIRITGETPIGRDQIMLHSQINRDAAKWVKIDWRLRERNGKFAILDIVILGISQLQVYRSEMMAVLRRNGRGVDGLIDALRAKNAALRSGK